MSIHSDVAMDQAYHPDTPPTDRERALVQAHQWGHLTRQQVVQKLGGRAAFVLSSLLVGPAAAVSSAGPTSAALDGVPTADLLAELDRRNSG